MSASLDVASKWNFRVSEQRLISVRTKNEKIRKMAVMDTLTGLMFAVEVPDDVSMQELQVGKEVYANLKVYTLKDASGIDKDFLGFFEALDVDQSMEDFIKAYWIYPSKIRFEILDIEEA